MGTGSLEIVVVVVVELWTPVQGDPVLIKSKQQIFFSSILKLFWLYVSEPVDFLRSLELTPAVNG